MTTELAAAAEEIAYWKRPVLPRELETTYKGTIYLGGPIVGQTYEQARHGWRAEFAEAMPPGIVCLSPMRHEGHLKEVGLIDDNALPKDVFSGHKFIFHKDLLDIRRADLVVFNFFGANIISKGSLVEIGIAYALGKTILVGMTGRSVHQHIFVRQAGLVFENEDDLIEAAKGLLSEGI